MSTYFPAAIRSAKRQHVNVLAGLLLALTCFVANAEPGLGEKLSASDIELIDGKIIPARELQGKVVIYLFWATWCPFCVAEMPSYQQLSSRYRAQGLEVLAISLDEEKEQVSAFRSQHGYELPMAMRSDAIRQVFGAIRGTPTVYVVDRSGVVRLKHMGKIDLGEFGARIRTLLNVSG